MPTLCTFSKEHTRLARGGHSHRRGMHINVKAPFCITEPKRGLLVLNLDGSIALHKQNERSADILGGYECGYNNGSVVPFLSHQQNCTQINSPYRRGGLSSDPPPPRLHPCTKLCKGAHIFSSVAFGQREGVGNSHWWVCTSTSQSPFLQAGVGVDESHPSLRASRYSIHLAEQKRGLLNLDGLDKNNVCRCMGCLSGASWPPKGYSLPPVADWAYIPAGGVTVNPWSPRSSGAKLFFLKSKSKF
jgi:hypothetical protein